MKHSSRATVPADAGSSSNQCASPLPASSAVDVAGKRLRDQQVQDRYKAAQDFIERTVGEPLSSNDLHAALMDGVVLCRCVFVVCLH
jgi:hypothetical protein